MSVSEAFRNYPPLRLLLLPLVAALPAFTQTPTFEGTSQVVAVEVPVNVTDRDGQPVRGLTAADFEVYDGNDPQKVTSFEMVDLKAVETTTRMQEPGAALPAGARRHFLLLFDLSFSTPTSVLKARMAARDFVLNSLHPADLAAVATYSIENGPKLVVTFTPDRAQLARGVDTLGVHQEAALRHDPLRFMIEPPASNPGGPGIAIGEGAQGSRGAAAEIRAQNDQALREHLQVISLAADKSERSFEASRLAGVTRALADMAKALNAVKGRKHVVYFSEGFNSNLVFGRSDLTEQSAETENLDAMFGRLDRVDNDTRFGNTALQGDLHRMLEEFRRADCVIQAVDIGGLRASADATGRPRIRGQESLFYMANETGGELFKDANNLRQPLERVLERTSVTYVLTFQRSDLKFDGSYHRLRVKAKLPPGARLSHRAGYYAPRPFKELNPLEKNLLASDSIASAAPRRDIDLSVLAAPFRATETRSYVPVIVEIGGRSLLAGQGEKDGKLNVEIYSYVSDSKGQMRDFFNQRVALDLGKGRGRESMLEGGIKYYGHFELEPGQYQVRVLVRNADTGRTGVQTVPMEVPAYAQAEPALLPPFFMEDRQRWLLVREQEGGQQGSVIYPFTVDGVPYVPAARPVLNREKPARLCLVAYNLGKGELAVQGRVLAADGKAFPAGNKLSQVERKATGIKGLDKLVATFDPAGLNAGDYVLQVAVTDPATGHKETNSLPFHVLH
ncbi:MAG TPA: VWA domain-containing protein [Thermoanaerobaculia bacterium]|jgi:VWFA-related protein